MGPPLTTKKSGEKFVEKDPFLVPLSNNNTDHTTVLVKTLDDVQVNHVNNTLSRHTMSLITGIFLIGLGFLCFTVSSQLESAFDQLVLSHTALSAGGPMFTAWFTPPIVPLLKVYVYNITNGAQVLAGEDPLTVELGPYVYSATHIRSLVQNEESEADSLAFRSRTNYQFMPHMSNGSESDKLTVLNMVMLTGFNKVRNHMGMVKTGVVLPLLTSLGRAEPVLTVTVGGFLFGYEDELACITEFGTNKQKTNDNSYDDDWDNDDWDDDDWEDDDWIKTEEELPRNKRDIPSYRDPSGKCLWGILRDLNNTEHETIRIQTGTSDYHKKGSIIDIDGKDSFGAWKPDSSCDRLKDSIEPSTLPAGLGSTFNLLVPVMCRNIDMVSKENFTIDGIHATRYIADPNSLAQDSCYCPDPLTPCLPSGYLNLEPCYPDISPPMAVSFPHGLHSPPNQMLTHTPSPNTTHHHMYMDINTKLGVPLAVQVRFQLSAVLRPDPSFPILNMLNTTRLVPLFWASEGFDQPNSWMVANTRLALSLPSAAAFGLAGGLTLLGGVIVLGWFWSRRRNSLRKE